MDKNDINKILNSDKDYLSKLIGLSKEVIGTSISFKDDNLEHKFEFHNKEMEIGKSWKFFILVQMAYSLSISVNLVLNEFLINRSFYFLISGVIIELIFAGVCHYTITKLRFKLHTIVKYLRFFYIYAVYNTILIFPVNSLSQEFYLRNFYFMFIFISLFQIYYLDFNYIGNLILPIFNAISIIYIQYSKNFPKYYFFPEFFSNLLFHFFIFQIKKSETENKRDSFFDYTMNQNITEYVKNLINYLNTFVISFKNNQLIYMNNYAINFFNKYIKNSSTENIEDALLTDRDKIEKSINQYININSYVKTFFDSLKYCNYLNKKEMYYGMSLSEIISEEMKIEIEEGEYFQRLGFFNNSIQGVDNCYEISHRKVNFKDRAIEILIYDVTEIKLAEKKMIENKYKQKLLAKIAHEFKTPLITIISLIQNLQEIQNIRDDRLYSKLNQISNLSNFSVVLVDDLILYVSDLCDFKTNLKIINLRELMNFSYEILKTLIQCNETKVNSIETLIKIDKNIDKVKILSHDTSLKQIFLNFISNSVKFTKYGFIKMKAKILKDEDYVEISVKDRGSGIKEQDYFRLFKDKITKFDLNIEDDYNIKGSGLGLSICNVLVNSLDHKIGYKSNKKEGSKFFIKIKIDKTKRHDESYISDQRLLENLELPISPMMNNTKVFMDENIREIQSKCNSQNLIILKKRNSELSGETPLQNFNFLKKDHDISKEDIIYKIEDRFKSLVPFSFSFTLNEMKIESNLRILVIDDHKFVRDVIVKLVTSVFKTFNIDNFEILEGCDGIALLDFVTKDKENAIKCILTDENMYYLNGSDAIRIIRKLEHSNKVNKYHIISITAFDDLGTKQNIMSSGVNEIISKPCTKSSIIHIFKELKIIP